MDDGFIGVVVVGMMWGFMFNGCFFGVFDGVVVDFEGELFEVYCVLDLVLLFLYVM